MKKGFLLFLVAFLTLPVFSIDTLTVQLDEFNENRALKQIIADNAGAKVIKLLRGGYYFIESTIDLTANTIIVGEKGTSTVAPPIILLQSKPDAGSYGNVILAKANLTLKNLYIPGVDETGNWVNFWDKNNGTEPGANKAGKQHPTARQAHSKAQTTQPD